mgnify:FL=1
MTSGESHESIIDEPTEGEAASTEPKRKLELDVQVKDAGACKKHITITIPRAEIDRQYEESLGSLQKEAHVPGFRPGRAPKTLVVIRSNPPS